MTTRPGSAASRVGNMVSWGTRYPGTGATVQRSPAVFSRANPAFVNARKEQAAICSARTDSAPWLRLAPAQVSPS